MQDWVKEIKIRLDTLTDDERKELLDYYCIRCGRKQEETRYGCQCWNDE